MAEKVGTIKLLIWIGILLFFGWFLIFSLAPEKILTTLAFPETQGFFLRMFGIFPLSWAVLFLFALKDVAKNLTIINNGIITGALVIIAFLICNFTMEITVGWFLWLSIVVLFIFNVLVFIIKPKAA